MTLANNLTETVVYNSRLQPCRINVNSSGTLLSNCNDALPSGNSQDFNANFNTGSDNGNVGGFTASGQQSFNHSYGYDSLNRIQSMSAPGISAADCRGVLTLGGTARPRPLLAAPAILPV
jgi:hypothetical protein